MHAKKTAHARAQVMRVAPYAVHPSYTFGGPEAKRHRLREEQAWLDPPSYYAPERPLLAVELHVPAVPDAFERLRSDYLAELHLKLMQHQLEQASAPAPCRSASNRLPDQVAACWGMACAPCGLLYAP